MRRGFQGDDGARGTPELPEQPAHEDPRGLLHLGDPAQAGDQQEDHREDMEADGQGGDDRDMTGHPIISLALLEFVPEYLLHPPLFSKSHS